MSGDESRTLDGPFGSIAAYNFKPTAPADYPVEWEDNDDGNLELTITLAELRPHPPWRHNENDVVLVLRNPDLEEVTVTYTATAHGYGTIFESEPFTIAVEQVDVFDTPSGVDARHVPPAITITANSFSVHGASSLSLTRGKGFSARDTATAGRPSNEYGRLEYGGLPRRPITLRPNDSRRPLF